VKLEVWRTQRRSGAFTARGRAAAERPTLLLRVDDGSARGLGEVAPLPELDGQTVEDAERALRGLAALGGLAGLPPPALVFGLELAFAARRATALGVPLARVLAPTSGAAGPLRNTRLIGALSDPGLEARARDLEGFTAVKIKLGPADRADAAPRLAALRAWIGEGMELRVDCNGSLSPRDLLTLAPALLAARVTFLEEPCPFEQLDELDDLPTPIFVDESLARLGPSILEHPRVRGAALKPTILGGLARTVALAREARALGRAFYVSHAFEGSVGMEGLTALALALEPGEMAQGLDASHVPADALAEIARELRRTPDLSFSLEEPAWTP
jgi:o-succinylbenzoate synthase